IIATAEASANLARFDGIRYGLRVEGGDPIELYSRTRGAGFGAEVKRRIILGTYVLSSGYYDAYYLRAQKVRTLIRQDFLKAFERVDAIVTPTTSTPAFGIGEKSDDPLQMYLSDIFTLSCNLAGICGLTLPCGFTAQPKLPIGLQLLGTPFGEAILLKLAHSHHAGVSKIHPLVSILLDQTKNLGGIGAQFQRNFQIARLQHFQNGFRAADAGCDLRQHRFTHEPRWRLALENRSGPNVVLVAPDQRRDDQAGISDLFHSEPSGPRELWHSNCPWTGTCRASAGRRS